MSTTGEGTEGVPHDRGPTFSSPLKELEGEPNRSLRLDVVFHPRGDGLCAAGTDDEVEGGLGPGSEAQPSVLDAQPSPHAVPQPMRAPKAVPPIAVVTGSCRLDWASPFFTQAEQRPLVLTAASAAAVDRAPAAEVAEVIVAGGDKSTSPAPWARWPIEAMACLGRRRSPDGCPAGDGRAAGRAVPDRVTPARRRPAARVLDGASLVPPVYLELDHALEADGYLFSGTGAGGLRPDSLVW